MCERIGENFPILFLPTFNVFFNLSELCQIRSVLCTRCDYVGVNDFVNKGNGERRKANQGEFSLMANKLNDDY
jgi:hypothetical protein